MKPINAPKLLVTHTLEEIAKECGDLSSVITTINLNAPFYCDRPGKTTKDHKFNDVPTCMGCLADSETEKGVYIDYRDLLSFFMEYHGTKIVTISGRGDPFHEEVIQRTFNILNSSDALGMLTYIFTAGDNLTDDIIAKLAETNTCVKVSLHGNRFVTEEVFQAICNDKLNRYEEQLRISGDTNQYIDTFGIAENIEKLIKIFRESKFGLQNNDVSRISFGYVLLPKECNNKDIDRIEGLRDSVNRVGIHFVANPYHYNGQDKKEEEILFYISRYLTNHHTQFATGFDGACHTGASSTISISYNGGITKCPHSPSNGVHNISEYLDRDGRINNPESLFQATKEYRGNPSNLACIMRGLLITPFEPSEQILQQNIKLMQERYK